MTASQRWLDATWPFVRASLPPEPGRVVDLGCGSEGGFVPRLRAEGYDAIGIDPEAPAEAQYQRVEFERAELPGQLGAIVASTSLHHVSDPAAVIDRITSALASGCIVATNSFGCWTNGSIGDVLGEGRTSSLISPTRATRTNRPRSTPARS